MEVVGTPNPIKMPSKNRSKVDSLFNQKKVGNESNMGPRDTQKTRKNEHRKTLKTCMKKGDARHARDATKVGGRGGISPTELLRRTTIQANPSKLTRAN